MHPYIQRYPDLLGLQPNEITEYVFGKDTRMRIEVLPAIYDLTFILKVGCTEDFCYQSMTSITFDALTESQEENRQKVKDLILASEKLMRYHKYPKGTPTKNKEEWT